MFSQLRMAKDDVLKLDYAKSMKSNVILSPLDACHRRGLW